MPKTMREKFLLGATMFLLLGALAYTRMKDSNIMSMFGGNSAEKEQLEAQKDGYLEILSRREKIEREFRAIENQYRDESAKTPDKHFTEQINKLCISLGFLGRQLDPPEFIPFPEVNDYDLILMNVEVRGEFAKIVSLLTQIHSMGYLLQRLEIRSRMDNDELQVVFEVARAVKQSEIRAAKRTRRGMS